MNKLVAALKDNKEEVSQLIANVPDWKTAFERFDKLFHRMSKPTDSLWSAATFNTFKDVYFSQRDKDKGMSNIVVRTIEGLPAQLHNESKMMFLQMAEVCCLFNASHKVNFDASELPENFDGIAMIPGKAKGTFTYAAPTASIYKKISLTFDYWVPKFIEWTDEIRTKGLKDWKGNAILEHESCTDFMRICLQFLSDTQNNIPIAKAEDREGLLKLFRHEFIWIKKSAKREDILTNSKNLKDGLEQVSKEAGITISLEAWSRLQQATFVKSVLK